MQIISWIVVIAVCFIVVISLTDFIRGGDFRVRMSMRDSRFSGEIFYTLFTIYIIVILGFGLIYFVLSMNHVLLVDNGQLREGSIVDSISHSLYFSGVTLLTIGYGDITPVGIGRFLALVKALIGYVLPAAFVLRLVQSNRENRDE